MSNDTGAQTSATEEEVVDLETFEGLSEEEEVEDEGTTTEEAATSTDEDKPVIPEKFKDKSIPEIIEIYQNLEKEYGRRNNEVGQLRQLTDKLLELERTTEESTEDEEAVIDSESLLDNPSEAINKAIENNPTLKAIREKLENHDRVAAQHGFESAHPDWKEVMASPEFSEWIKKSPLRHKMFVEADKNYDYATGAALVSEYKELHPAQTSTDTDAGSNEQEELEETARQLATENKSKSGKQTKLIFSRAQIIDMRVNNPAKYERMKGIFQKAYAEGRVR